MQQEWYFKLLLPVVPEVMQLTLILTRIKEAVGSENNGYHLNSPPLASDTLQGEFSFQFIWMFFSHKLEVRGLKILLLTESSEDDQLKHSG